MVKTTIAKSDVTVNLELSEKEAAFIYTLCMIVGGSMNSSRRHAEDIVNAIHEHRADFNLIDQYNDINCYLTGSIYFSD